MNVVTQVCRVIDKVDEVFQRIPLSLKRFTALTMNRLRKTGISNGIWRIFFHRSRAESPRLFKKQTARSPESVSIAGASIMACSTRPAS